MQKHPSEQNIEIKMIINSNNSLYVCVHSLVIHNSLSCIISLDEASLLYREARKARSESTF